MIDRDASLGDMTANIAGIVLGWLPSRWIRGRWLPAQGDVQARCRAGRVPEREEHRGMDSA
ncbi:MAG: hypothetical protein H0T88_06035 [Lysobacter sp.]|nr:hypothetical protein [Lysobacter sp.]